MKFQLHPEAALEHEEQVSYYESQATGLGARYHTAFISSVKRVCKSPKLYRVIAPPAVRKARVLGFPFSILYREVEGEIQVLAIAHHRRRPGYWASRL